MGQVPSNIFNKVFGKADKRLLMVGLDASGNFDSQDHFGAHLWASATKNVINFFKARFHQQTVENFLSFTR